MKQERMLARLDRGMAFGFFTFLVFMFIEIVGVDWIGQLDESVTSWIAGARKPALNSFFHFVTIMGNTSTLTIFTIAVAVFLLIAKVRPAWVIWFVGLVFLGGVILNPIIKEVVQRVRPDEAFRLLDIHSYSFPSGHSLSTIICFGGLAYLLANAFFPPSAKTARKSLIIVACCLSASIAFSRVYLGVHYLTDVLAGFILGTSLLLFFIKMTKTLPLFTQGIKR